ncbi:hypothetical protein WN51_08988 [Melipona quadrifasciata]|uniref:Uncharacterized protein n=1 Tax=Melipona quadrifasciata TaxID=166423 RepID=A0A0N0BK54_9HYME|nr:hypothetical protein WN51_08988 [Melipona quadrifasciata]
MDQGSIAKKYANSVYHGKFGRRRGQAYGPKENSNGDYKRKESTEALSVSFPSASGNCGPKVGHKRRMCFARVWERSMLQFTVEGLVYRKTKLSQTRWPGFYVNTGLFRALKKSINFLRCACTQTGGIVAWKFSRTQLVKGWKDLTNWGYTKRKSSFPRKLRRERRSDSIRLRVQSRTENSWEFKSCKSVSPK